MSGKKLLRGQPPTFQVGSRYSESKFRDKCQVFTPASRVKQIYLLTIGGKHSREAVFSLIKSGSKSFGSYNSVQCDMFCDLTQEEIIAAGYEDNCVAAAVHDYSLHEKAELIRRMFKNSLHREGGKAGIP